MYANSRKYFQLHTTDASHAHNKVNSYNRVCEIIYQ